MIYIHNSAFLAVNIHRFSAFLAPKNLFFAQIRPPPSYDDYDRVDDDDDSDKFTGHGSWSQANAPWRLEQQGSRLQTPV